MDTIRLASEWHRERFYVTMPRPYFARRTHRHLAELLLCARDAGNLLGPPRAASPDPTAQPGPTWATDSPCHLPGRVVELFTALSSDASTSTPPRQCAPLLPAWTKHRRQHHPGAGRSGRRRGDRGRHAVHDLSGLNRRWCGHHSRADGALHHVVRRHQFDLRGAGRRPPGTPHRTYTPSCAATGR